MVGAFFITREIKLDFSLKTINHIIQEIYYFVLEANLILLTLHKDQVPLS